MSNAAAPNSCELAGARFIAPNGVNNRRIVPASKKNKPSVIPSVARNLLLSFACAVAVNFQPPRHAN